ncbi:MAG TPA: amidohydrolase family protein [archaeon]|nr:amidohydrolase family protein [archaeon]
MRFSGLLPTSIARILLPLAPFILMLSVSGCSEPKSKTETPPQDAGKENQTGMTVEELAKMPKIDAHVHLRGLEEKEVAPLLARLEEHNMRWLTISTRGMSRDFLLAQINLAARLHSIYPEWIAWATSFSLENWGSPDWEKEALETMEDGFQKGAVAVKVWKDIGMVLKDPDSSFVMIDDPRFDPIFDYVERRNKTLVAHIGEPRNCWLPLDSMTVNNDRRYFAENPQYHCYLHPEIPNYTEQIASRDRVLQKHPGLRFVGCHLGSLEYDVDEIARRFDKYPQFAVDLAARVCHLQVQDREKVRNFIIKYQDRLLYGTDLGAGYVYTKSDIEATLEQIEETYRKDYRYFATDEEMDVWEVDGKFRGLALPDEVLKKIFYENARKWYPGI